MRLLIVAAWLLVFAASGLRAAADLGAAITLFKSKRYPEAHEAFTAIVAADPKNAAACHHLGRLCASRLVLDPRVEILGVLTNDDQVHVLVA